ncbi:alpha/beta fold hydrolase [Luminiphilus syltensis]|uniref:alpha/beta fold hydrolase n=1 Tax=Luminiphilus syltensis TaxID=1341119 RepID=UPI0002F13534|nr:alpha/beta hydrolase [Luminiphilus syltensis]
MNKSPNAPTLPPAIDADIGSVAINSTTQCRYYREDNPSGRPLVLLHSINAAPSSMEMRPLFEHYRGTRPVVAFDLPGFGISDRPQTGYSAEFFGAAISAMVDSLDGDPPDIIALSLTSEFVARAIVDHGLRCHSLVAISPTGLGERNPPGDKFGENAKRVFSKALIGSSIYSVLRTRPSVRFFLNKAFVGRAPDELVDYAVKTTRQPNARFAALAFLTFSLFSRQAIEALYGRVEVPALVLFDEDPNIGFERLPELLDHHKNWSAKRVSPSRGIPQWELPEATFEALDTFWGAL